MKNRKYHEYADNPDGLKALDPKQLQVMWADLFKGRPRPRSKGLVIHEIAYFLQERDQDSLSPQMQERLDTLAENPLICSGKKFNPKKHYKFVREWNGKTYTVSIISKDQFLYDGRIYDSLSVIADKITGSHWSGPLFFGLRKQHARKR